MKAKRRGDKSQLRMCEGFLHDGSLRDAYRSLICRVFGQEELGQTLYDSGLWWPLSAFEQSGLCVATVEVRRLHLILDGIETAVAGLRRVAVDPDWRGMGLLRDLMAPALRWCDAKTDGLTLLYTEEPALYERFGFAALSQYAFTGRLEPLPTLGSAIRRLDIAIAEDRALVDRMLAARVPLSLHCSLIGAADIALQQIDRADDFELVYAIDLDVLILFEDEGDHLTVVDVIGPAIPSMMAIVAALGRRPGHVTTLFSPDRFGWSGRPKLDDTGLMCRGALPPAMTRPFMLPPTAEF